MTDHETAAAIEKQSKSCGRIVDIEWNRHGTKSPNGKPGVEYKATVRVGDAPRRFLIFIPAPYQSKRQAKVNLARFLRGESLISTSSVKEI